MNEADVAARLAEALLDADYESIDKAHWREVVGDDQEASYDAYIAALLPVVREIAYQRAAEELEAAATCQLNGSGGRPLGWLRARAAALREATDA